MQARGTRRGTPGPEQWKTDPELAGLREPAQDREASGARTPGMARPVGGPRGSADEVSGRSPLIRLPTPSKSAQRAAQDRGGRGQPECCRRPGIVLKLATITQLLRVQPFSRSKTNSRFPSPSFDSNDFGRSFEPASATVTLSLPSSSLKMPSCFLPGVGALLDVEVNCLG